MARALSFLSMHDIHGGYDALPTHTHTLPALAPERVIDAAHRKPLRKQLWRSAAAPQRHHGEAGVPRIREDAGLCDQRLEARGTDRAQFHAAARAVFREP